MLYQLSCEATYWERGQIIAVISQVKSEMMWSIYACSCRSLWSSTTVQIYELFHIYFTSFHSQREIWTQLFGLPYNVWLHSSVGRAWHRHRGGHGFESRWSLDFSGFSSSQLLKLEKFTAMIIPPFDLQLQFKYMNYLIYTSHHFTLHGRYELNCLASLTMCGFMAQLVQHGNGIAEVTGSNLVEALIFSGFFFPIA